MGIFPQLASFAVYASFFLALLMLLALALPKSALQDFLNKRLLSIIFGFLALALFIFPFQHVGVLFLGLMLWFLFLGLFHGSGLLFLLPFSLWAMGFYYLPTWILEEEKTFRKLASDGELFVAIPKGQNPEAVLSRLIQSYELDMRHAFPQAQEGPLRNYYLLDLPEHRLEELQALRSDLLALEEAVFIEDNELIQVWPSASTASSAEQNRTLSSLYNDPDVGKQWALQSLGLERLAQLYQRGQNPRAKKKAKLFILDTGIDAKHEDLQKNLGSFRGPHALDPHGHGTHCAGIAAAVSNNNKGIASALSSTEQLVEVYSIAVFDASGSGSQERIVDAIIDAVNAGADVISLSLGGYSSDKSQLIYKEVLDYALQRGCILVAAAGNESMSAKEIVPAGVQGYLVVTALDKELQLAPFSNHGRDIAYALAAPGVDIFSCLPGNSYGFMSGTSMATPYVASLLALCKAYKPELSNTQAYRLIKKTGASSQNPSESGPYIQADALLQRLWGED